MDADVEQFLTPAEEEQVVAAIRAAEKQTSGEIRVHLEKKCDDAYERAQEVFHLLKMDNTELHNGVLFYFAVESHKFSLIGDSGINEKVGAGFWTGVKDEMQTRFTQGEFAQGIVDGIHKCGEQLATYFPWQHDDVNELPDEVTKGPIE
jgi:uncharacterized membrane protein